MLMSPFAEEVARAGGTEEKVAGGRPPAPGNPWARYMPMWVAAGIKVIPVVASSAGMAKLVDQEAGACRQSSPRAGSPAATSAS